MVTPVSIIGEFGERTTRGGYEIIENCIVEQPWSNGKAGIQGRLGLRYRNFRAKRGMHLTLNARAPITLTLFYPQVGTWRMKAHHREPSGKANSGLPETISDALDRRNARCVLQSLSDPPPPGISPRDEAVGSHLVDLRWK
jgi:hypothetical protein